MSCFVKAIMFLCVGLALGEIVPNEKVRELENIIGYKFDNKLIIMEAMIHSSCGMLFNNERLSWLGDSILSGVISSILYQKFPYTSTEQLHETRQKLILRKTFAADGVSANFDVNGSLIYCTNMISQPTEQMLGEFVEAIFGAIYQDSQNFTTVIDIYQNKFPVQVA
eukprot:TRINITY_DN2208_c0_g1_i3.p1 TRINITY_DN2208_c0_g1~~TRINITY_DN2208_c0_g1_i3.p1  ORF type:complete len:167 (+),score=11.42 TRINITY_DN2208_c0_g1_i3:134-634(+)